jgi:hypothetical protein
MADIAMCNNEDCKKAEKCYRFKAERNPLWQSYLGEPKKDCIDQDYKMFWNYKKV